jgi:hypothetical protein
LEILGDPEKKFVNMLFLPFLLNPNRSKIF